MNNTVFVKSYKAPEFNIREILRYMGCGRDGEEFVPLVEECIAECGDKLTYKVCYCGFDIQHTDCGLDLGFIKTQSRDLKKNLESCSSIVLFGATVGIELDRLISKYGRISPSKALVFQAIGAERIEALCNAFNDDVKENNFTSPRFSPGYGDFPLEYQKGIFDVLDCSRRIGLSLNRSMLMTPTKSVTAIIGISDVCNDIKGNSCSRCPKTDCKYRS